MSLDRDQHSLAPGAIVDLITLDASRLGGGVLRFTTGPLEGAPVRFGGQPYRPLPSRLSGVSRGGSRPATPLLEVVTTDTALIALMARRDDLTGARVSRLRTLARYLDGEPAADATQHWPVDLWLITGVAKRDAATISWRLATPLAFDGAHLPGRQVLRDVCPFTYRAWDDQRWLTGQADCPYRGNQSFNLNDEPVDDPAADQCSRRISGCQVRFGENAVLPFGGFAGVGRGRQ